MPRPRILAFLLLALANLLWAGNWIAGRALREAFEPVELNFWRWVVATLVLAPFALPRLRGKRAVLRRHAGILLLLAFAGVALFQSLVYLGLRTTTAVNAVLLNSSLLSFCGILVILARGDPASLLQFELHAGDAWILLAMPVWGIYSVLLKRRPL